MPGKPEGKNPLLAVIIPLRNGLFHLKYSLQTLKASWYSHFFCVIVDDGSSDGSIDFVKREFPELNLLFNCKRKGFAGAVNTGIGYALERGADFVAVSNTDIKVPPQWMDSALRVFRSEEGCGLVGFTEVPRQKEELFEEDRNADLVYREAEGVPGCLFVCPAEVFRGVGLLDEGYFMYGEDNDFFARLRRAGYRIFQTNVPVWHYNEGSGKSAKFVNAWLTYRNAVRYVLKNEGTLRIVRMLGALLYYGCNPFPMDPTGNPSLGRLRRYNAFVNLLLLLSACGWNLFHLPGTLRLRVRDRKSAIQSRICRLRRG